MKRTILLFIFVIISFNFCESQEWFTSLEVAKKLALIQDKMLFVVWEESLDYSYPLLYNTEKGDVIIVDISENTSLDAIIWEYFIPVLLPESNYVELSNQIKETRGIKYYNKLIDDSIKIMDANKNILNLKVSEEYEQNLSAIIKNYSLRTNFLKQDLINYSKNESVTTSYSLASKYLDFAILSEKDIRFEIIQLANIYFDEAKKHLPKSDLNNKMAFLQNCDLLVIKEYLILNKPRKAIRYLKKISKTEIYNRNQSLFSFLNYIAYKLLKDKENAALWKSKISLVDLKKAKLILNLDF